MFNKVLLTLSLIFNAYNISMPFKYSIALQNEVIFVPSNISGVYFADRHLGMSDVKFAFLANGSNGSVYSYGSVILTKDLGTEHVGEDTTTLQVFKKNRDIWSPTIYNMKRPDACQAVFNPTEIWHEYTKNISKENRKGPFFVGDIIIPKPNLVGNYMGIFMAHLKGVDEYICLKIFAEVNRS